MGKIFIHSIEKLTQVLIAEGHPDLGLATLPRIMETATPGLYNKGEGLSDSSELDQC